MHRLEKNLNSLIVFILSCVLLTALYIQFFKHEEPCPLCLLQRAGMFGVAIGALLNMRVGIRVSHYGVSLLSAFSGGFVSLRQISLHACPDFPEWGVPFLGLNLYTWAFIIFVTTVVVIALLLIFFDHSKKINTTSSFNWWCWLSFTLIFLAVIINIGATFNICGIGTCSE